MFKKQIIYSLALFALSLVTVSCELFELIEGPNYPDSPKISFKEITKTTNFVDPVLGNKGDLLVISIKFQDGDGDLGLSEEDKINDPRFRLNNPDGTPNPYHANYFVTVFRKQNGEFQEFEYTPSLSGAFRPLNAANKPGPIEGTLDRSIFFPYGLGTPVNDTLQFRIQIVDKNLNASNEIQTDFVVINQK